MPKDGRSHRGSGRPDKENAFCPGGQEYAGNFLNTAGAGGDPGFGMVPYAIPEKHAEARGMVPVPWESDPEREPVPYGTAPDFPAGKICGYAGIPVALLCPDGGAWQK